MEGVKNSVIKIISEKFDVLPQAVKPSNKFLEDFNTDSLDLIELVMSVEELFSIKITDAEAEKIITVQDLIDHVQGAVKENA